MKHRHTQTRSLAFKQAFGHFKLVSALDEPEEAEPPAFIGVTIESPGHIHRLLKARTTHTPLSHMDAPMSREETNQLMETKRERAAAALTKDRARDHRRKPVPPVLANHPAIICFRAVCNRYPAKPLMAEVAKSVGDKPNEAWMRECFTEWIKRGFRPTNLAWLFEWYLNRRIPGRRAPIEARHDVGTSQPTLTSDAAEIAAFEALRPEGPLSTEQIMAMIDAHEKGKE